MVFFYQLQLVSLNLQLTQLGMPQKTLAMQSTTSIVQYPIANDR